MSSSGLQGGSAVSINLMEVVIVPESKTVYANVVDSEASSRIDLDKCTWIGHVKCSKSEQPFLQCRGNGLQRLISNWFG